MKAFTLAIFCTSACIIGLLTSCGSSGSGSVSENLAIRGYNPGVGPFDSSGNYVERWADDKRKGTWWRKSSFSSEPTKRVAKKDPPRKLQLPANPPALAAVTPKPIIPTYKPSQYTAPLPKPVVKSKPKPVVKSKPKPAVKVAPKRKAPVRYVVKKGDTLWSLSNRYKVSITSIQTANGLKNTTLKTGGVILIPQY